MGLEKALAGYASWMNGTLIPGYCMKMGYFTEAYDISCFDSYNTSGSEDLSPSNPQNRQWKWMLVRSPPHLLFSSRIVGRICS